MFRYSGFILNISEEKLFRKTVEGRLRRKYFDNVQMMMVMEGMIN